MMADTGNWWQRAATARISRRRMMTRAGLVAGSIGVAVGIGCGSRRPAAAPGQPSAASGTPQQGGTLNVSQISGPTTLDVQRTTSFYTIQPAGAVQSRLMRFKTGIDPKTAEDHDVEADIALSVESPDAVTWTVKLRPDAKYHNVPPVNGRLVEAEDIKATFTRAASKDNPASGSLSMIDPDQIQTPDKTTVIFKLKYPYAPFNKTLASASYSYLFPRDVLTGAYDPAKTFVGSGPFLLDSFQPDVGFSFKRNPEYYDKGRPYVDNVRYSIIPDAAQRQAQFTSGNLDTLGEAGSTISPNDVDTLRRTNPKARFLENSPQTGGPDCLFFQMGDQSSPFQDVRLRRAVSTALDRDSLAKTMWGDKVEPGGFYVGHDFGKWALRLNDLSPDVAQYYKFDPAVTKKLLAESGNADRQFKLVYVTGYLAPPYDTAAQTIANMLQSAGFKISLLTVDYQKDYIGGGKGIRYGNYPPDEIIFAGISTFTEADEFVFNYYDSQGTSGISRLKDPALDDMILKARAIVNEPDRVTAYKNIQKYLADKMYTVMGFSNPTQKVMVNPRVQNYQRVFGYGFFAETYTKLWLQKS
jgi:peptide/nickel transport system substrate-binding protein